MATVFRPPLVLKTWRSGDQYGIAARSQSEVWQNNLVTNLKPSTDKFFGTSGRPLTDFQNPLLPIVHSFKNRWEYDIGINNLLNKIVTIPFVNYDFPNTPSKVPSVLQKTHTERYNLNLLKLDKFFDAPGMGPNYDYPNPVGKIPSILLKTHTDPYKTNLAGKDKFFSAPGQGPAYDYPNPIPPRRSVELLTSIMSVALCLQVAAPFNQDDFPNPRGPVAPIELRTWAESPNQNLASKDQFTAGGNNFDWPNPVRSIVRRQDWQAFVVPAAAPFFQIDWPNPRGSIPNIDLKTWIQVSGQNFNLAGQDILGGVGTKIYGPHFSNARTVDSYYFSSDAQLLAVAPPFFQIDWPNPRGAQQGSISLKTQLASKNLAKDTFYGLAGAPNFDWPNPRGPVHLRIDWSRSQFQGVDTFTAGGNDFDYPNPRGAVGDIELRTFLQGPSLSLTTAPAPFNQDDWPNPRGSVPGITLKTWSQSQFSGLVDTFFGLSGNPSFDWPNPVRSVVRRQDWLQPSVSTVVAPFLQSDWPVPVSPRRTIGLWTWTQSRNLGTDTLFDSGRGWTFDWPNPQAPRRFISDSYSTSIALTSVQVRPFYGLAGSPTDWPNPRGPVSTQYQKWTDNLSFTIAQQIFFGLAGNPNYDWPNPRGPQQGSIDLKTWLQSANLSTDKFFGLAGHPTFDFPNPRGSVPNISLKTHTASQNLGKDTFYGLAGSPTFDFPNPRGPIGDIDLRTWLQFAPQVIALPFVEDNQFPNPRGPIRSTDLLTWIQPGLQVVAAPFNPFNRADFPNPWGPIPSIGLRTWTDPLKINLLGKDSLGFVGSEQFGPTFRSFRTVESYGSNITLLTPPPVFILPPGLGPTNQTDWPNPRGSKTFVNYTWVESTKLNLLSTDQGPAQPTVGQSLHTRVHAYQSVFSQFPGADTFFGLAGNPQFDWPNPIAAKRSIELWTWVKPGLQVTALPFSQPDWPNPKGPQQGTITLKTHLGRITLGLTDTFFGVAGNPQKDWPNPRGAVRSIDLITWAKSAPQVTALPFENYDWPNPIRPVPGIALKTWTQNSPQVVALPFRQNDNPNPRGYPPRIDLYTWFNSTPQVQALPFRQNDNPNPRGPIPSILLKTFLGRNTLGIKEQYPPVITFDWPNPTTRRPRSIDALTWTQSPFVTGIPAHIAPLQGGYGGLIFPDAEESIGALQPSAEEYFAYHPEILELVRQYREVELQNRIRKTREREEDLANLRQLIEDAYLGVLRKELEPPADWTATEEPKFYPLDTREISALLGQLRNYLEGITTEAELAVIDEDDADMFMMIG